MKPLSKNPAKSGSGARIGRQMRSPRPCQAAAGGPARNAGGTPERPAGTVDPKLLEILVCPLTKGPLEYDSAKQELISRSAKLAYPIRDGIPIMLPEEARKID